MFCYQTFENIHVQFGSTVNPASRQIPLIYSSRQLTYSLVQLLSCVKMDFPDSRACGIIIDLRLFETSGHSQREEKLHLYHT